MPPPGEGQGQAAAEQARTVERFSVGENRARLGSQRDAVCDGRTVQLSSVERSRKDTPDQAEARQKNAAELADRLSKLTKPGQAAGSTEPLFATPPTADRLLHLDQELAKLTHPDTGRFAGLLVNIQGARARGASDVASYEASSVGMVAFVDYLAAHQNDPGTQADILKGAYGAVREAYRALGIQEDPSFAAVLIDSKSGEMVSVRSKDAAVVIVDDDAQPADRVKQTKASTVSASGEPEVGTRTVKKGEKIILCDQVSAAGIKGENQSVGTIVDNLTHEQPVDPSKRIEIRSAQEMRSPRSGETPPKESEDRIFAEGHFAGVIDGVGGYVDGGKAAQAVQEGLTKMIHGEAFSVTTSTGQVIEIPAGEALNFDGMPIQQVRAKLTEMAEHLNRMIRGVDTRTDAEKKQEPGPAACFAVGDIHLDISGKLRLSYMSVGDSEIAIIRNGQVILVPNDSVRHRANQGHPPNIDFYLNEREAAANLAGGQKTMRLNQEVNTGSIILQEGDRVVYLTDGVAEDLQNVRGTVAPDGTITPQAGEGGPIALDILAQIPPNTPVDQMPKAILALLDSVRQQTGTPIERQSQTYQSTVHRKIVNQKGQNGQGDLHVIVGGKGPTQDRGYDDGESVVVVEAHVNRPPRKHAAAGEAVDSKKTTAPRKEKAPAPEPKPKAPEPAADDQEADTEVETVRHKPPFWADKKDEPVRANEYMKSASVLTNLTTEQLRTRGIDAQTPGVSLIDRGNGRYDAVINIFQANRAWARGAMDALHGSDTSNLPVAEQKKLLQQIQEQLSWEQDNDQNPARATVLAVEHPLAKAFTHSQTADQIMTVEVMMRQLDAPTPEQLAASAREALVKGLRARLGQEAGVAARGKVVHRGEQISEEGDFQKLFTEAGGVNETVRRDMAAADLMLDVCGDLKVNPAELSLRGITIPEGTTYQDARKQLTDAITAASKSGDKAARTQALKAYNQFRLVFYGHVHDALGPRGTLSAQDVLGAQIRERIETFDLQKAIEGHHMKRPKSAFDGLEPTSVKDMALKGIEMYIRLIKDPINLEVKPQEPDLGIIYNKQFIQSEAEALQYLQPPKRKTPTPPKPTPPPKKGDNDTPPPMPPRKGGDDDGGGDDGGGGNGKEKPKPAPCKPEGGDDVPPPGPPRKEGDPGLEGGPKPAPTGEQDHGPKPVDPAPPGHTPPTPQPLPMSANLGAGAAQNAGAQNIVQLADHVGATDLARMKKPFYAKIPLLGGVLYSLRHPVKLIWQNNLARSVFEQQRVRFAADFRNIVKGATDQTVPVDVSPQLLDLALEKGRQLRKSSNLLRRMVWGASDFVKGITGISQTSEMILAKKWLREEMVGTRRTQWSADLQRVTSNILTEQTNLGERFALMPKEWTLEQANAHALTYQGETRRSLMKDIEGGPDGEQARGVNRELRAMVEGYCTGNPPMTQEELVGKVNAYLKSEAFRNLLPADQRRMMQTSELATNIVNIAESVKGRWSEYGAEAEGGGKVFDKFTFNVLYGKAEWGGVRGHRETSFLTEVLARRLAERSVGGAELGYAASLANDIITYGGAYLAGAGSSALNNLLVKLPRAALVAGTGPIGGVLGMGVMSTIKETGFSIPVLNKIHWNWAGHEFHPFTYVGRTAKDAGQASREAARGALEGAKGTIRSEMEKTLVKRKEAPALASSVESMLRQENMTDEQAMQLLTTLADIDARMRLSDLSGTIHMNYHTQNYLGFTGGQENAQYLALKKSLLDGIVRLQAYGAAHPTFMHGQGAMFTGTSMQYGQKGQNLGLFEKMSALAEAQLRVSSDVDVVSQWMRRELRMTDAEATAFMKDFYAEQKMVSATAEADTLRAKERNLRNLTLKRGAATLVKSVLMAHVAGAIYGGVSSVVSTGVSEIGDVLKEGPQEWAADWGKVLQGNIPIDTSTGHIVADLSPLQQQFILAHNIVSPPLDFSGRHDESIDGINIQLPGHLQYYTDGHGHDGLINLQNGTVAKDMSGMEIHGEVVGGHSVMVYTDAAGNHVAGDPIADFKSVGIDVKPIDPIHGTTTAEIWNPGTTTHVQTVEGHQVTVPANAEWKYDATTHAWDLKATDGAGHVQTATDGHEITLVQDAQFGADGRIVSFDSIHSGVTFANGAPRLEGGGVTVEHHDVVGPDGRWDETSGRYGFTFMKGASTSMQDYKGTNAAGEAWYQVHAGGSTATAPDGTVYSIGDAAANHQLGFAIQIPGHGTFLVPPNQGNTDLRLDPADTHTFHLANGTEMTYGELAKMVINQDALKAQPNGFLGTEWKHHTDVLALKPDGREWGSISSVIVPSGTVEHPQTYVYNGPPVDTNGMITSPGTHMDGSVLAYAAVRGTAPASEQGIDITHGTPPVEVFSPSITAEKISDTVDTYTPAFVSTATSAMTYTFTPPGLFPIPLGRENIEKAEYGSGTGTSTGTDSSGGGSQGGSPSGQGGTQPPPVAAETGARVPAMKPEEMVALAKLKIRDKDKQKEGGHYQAELLPALAEFEVIMESGSEAQIEVVRKKVVKALKSCHSEDPEAAARTIERTIRDKQNVSETEKQARIAAKKKEDEGKKKETDRATELMRVMGIELRTAKEREVGSPTLKHFETIMAEMKIYAAAFEKNDTATLTESGRRLKALLKTEWGVKKDEDQDAKMEMLRAQLEREREIAVAQKAKAEQDAAQEQLRRQQEAARNAPQEQSGSAAGAAST